mmetsp:Transcript_49467/g.107726  ORF Transcript_49467/g.107726 Transcript_49467/m.107726 type:complete len:276 (+) Transcript_49467:357-1184(+)
MSNAFLVENVSTRRRLDDILRLPGAQANGTFPGVGFSLLVSEQRGLVLQRTKLRDRVWRGSSILWHADASGCIYQQLVVPVRKDEAEHAQRTTADGVHLKPIVKVRRLCFACGRLHQVKPKEQGAHHENVQWSIAQSEVDTVGAAKTMGVGLDQGHPGRHTRHEQNCPCTAEPGKVDEEHFGIIGQLVVIVLAGVIAVILNHRQDTHQVVDHPSNGERHDEGNKGLEHGPILNLHRRSIAMADLPHRRTNQASSSFDTRTAPWTTGRSSNSGRWP